MMDINDFRECVSYNPKTGILLWKKSLSNRSKVGSRFGANIDGKGYYRAVFKGKQYRTHRLAWFHYYGEMPDGLIDHINGDRLDNRIENLRIADETLNARNCLRSKNNTSGHTGVTRHKAAKKWVAQITVSYKNVYLGLFDSLDDAVAARKKAEAQYFGNI
jgi:hypothetical protein